METKNIIITIIVILLAIFLIFIMYFNKTSSPAIEEEETINENVEQPISNLPDTSPEPLSMVQVYFNESLSIEPQGAKSQVTHTVILPILKNIFDSVPSSTEEPIIVGVKLKNAQNDNSLTYVFNRICTDSDVEMFKSSATNIGTTIKENNNPIQLDYSGLSFTFNFWLNDQQKSGVDVSF